MTIAKAFALLALVPLMVASCSRKPMIDPIAMDTLPEFNRIVLDVAASYPTDGTHGYWWPKKSEGSYDGVSEDILLDGVCVMRGEEKGRTYCCGLTLEVFVKALARHAELHGASAKPYLVADGFSKFKRLWFVENVNGPGPSAAFEAYGLGKTILEEDALPGDFVQIWRRFDPNKAKSPSGHSVIFTGWARNKTGEIVGMEYFSTQTSTKGISRNVELWGAPNAKKGMARENTHWGRVDLAAK